MGPRQGNVRAEGLGSAVLLLLGFKGLGNVEGGRAYIGLTGVARVDTVDDINPALP